MFFTHLFIIILLLLLIHKLIPEANEPLFAIALSIALFTCIVVDIILMRKEYSEY